MDNLIFYSPLHFFPTPERGNANGISEFLKEKKRVGHLLAFIGPGA
jgi:hypothetical protein